MHPSAPPLSTLSTPFRNSQTERERWSNSEWTGILEASTSSASSQKWHRIDSAVNQTVSLVRAEDSNQQPFRTRSGNASTATRAAKLDPKNSQIPELLVDLSSRRFVQIKSKRIDYFASISTSI